MAGAFTLVIISFVPIHQARLVKCREVFESKTNIVLNPGFVSSQADTLAVSLADCDSHAIDPVPPAFKLAWVRYTALGLLALALIAFDLFDQTPTV